MGVAVGCMGQAEATVEWHLDRCSGVLGLGGLPGRVYSDKVSFTSAHSPTSNRRRNSRCWRVVGIHAASRRKNSSRETAWAVARLTMTRTIAPISSLRFAKASCSVVGSTRPPRGGARESAPGCGGTLVQLRDGLHGRRLRAAPCAPKNWFKRTPAPNRTCGGGHRVLIRRARERNRRVGADH